MEVVWFGGVERETMWFVGGESKATTRLHQQYALKVAGARVSDDILLPVRGHICCVGLKWSFTLRWHGENRVLVGDTFLGVNTIATSGAHVIHAAKSSPPLIQSHTQSGAT